MCDQLNRTAKNRCLNCGQAKRFREENIWEGINLKKISKKIVSLVTLAAFALTLVPAAAFAADATSESTVNVKTVTTGSNGATTAVVDVTVDANTAQNGKNVYVWVEKDNAVYEGATFADDFDATNGKSGDLKNAGVAQNPEAGTYTATITINTSGDYTIHAGIEADNTTANNRSELTLFSVAEGGSNAVNSADNQSSSYFTVEENVEVDAGDPVETAFQIKADDNTASGSLSNVVVWAEDAGNNITSAADFTSDEATVKAATNNDKVFVVNQDTGVADGTKLDVTFSRGGDYKIYAATVKDVTAIHAGQIRDTVFKDNELAPLIGQASSRNTVKVSNVAATTDVYSLDVAQEGAKLQSVKDNGSATLLSVLPNKTDKKTVTLTAKDENGNTLSGKEFTVTTNSGLTVTGDNTTDVFGQIELDYQASKAGKYTINVVCDDFNAKLIVDIQRDEAAPDKFIVAKDGGVADITKVTDEKNFANAVQLNVVDKDGNAVSKDNSNWSKEPIWKGTNVGDQKLVDYVEIVTQPDKAKLTDKDVQLVYDDVQGVYTLKINNAPTLKEGDYTVSLSLLSGKNVEVDFTLAKAGDPVALEFDGKDTVAADSNYNGTLWFVDKNGLKTAVTNANSNTIIGYQGNGVADAKDLIINDDNKFSFTAKDGEAYYGTKVTLYAIDNEKGLSATKDITIVDPTITESVTFDYDSTNGAANQDNTVKLTLVDENGKVMKELTGVQLNAFVASSSVEDANVTVDTNNVQVTNGKATFTVYADKETEAEILVSFVKDGKMYADTLTYTFGEQDVNADKIVAMTIGSTDYIVNNDIVKGDAAPYVDGNWRTMVPVRALAETFGATVDFDNDTRVITIVDGDTEIVMTVGETAYTVNGEEANMDTAPVIGDSDRTYVPVRFVAEALGYTVTPLQDANNLTAGVVFQK